MFLFPQFSTLNYLNVQYLMGSSTVVEFCKISAFLVPERSNLVHMSVMFKLKAGGVCNDIPGSFGEN